MTNIITNNFILEPQNNKRLANLCGKFDEHLRQLENRFDVKINNRGHQFRIIGLNNSVHNVTKILKQLYITDDMLEPANIHLVTQESNVEMIASKDKPDELITKIRTRRGTIRPKGANQVKYLDNIVRNDINFGIGPAGTGKSFLAVACAVDALEQELVRRIILVRPAVEAGERLGFLPGDLAQKVDPYLRPLYDALYEMLGFERVGKLIERQVI
ncbi:MAG: PhoH family protein, partial [Candidatus Marithrix sp.]|nr:PhoH family protein [Candidatus Marithrix sp.]